MSVFSYLITILGILFWIFRAIVTALYTSGISFIIMPLNVSFEIALIFATIPCMIFVLKRNIIGAAFYVAIYVSYFGTAIYNTFNHVSDTLNVYGTLELIIAIIGIAIPVLTFIDILFNKYRKPVINKNSKTDWYYNNKKYDRQYDERADRNQYKIR